MKININKTDINLDNCKNGGDILINFTNYLVKILSEYKVDYIITNGNIASILQDSIYYRIIPQVPFIGLVHNGEPYLIGNLSDKDLYDNSIINTQIIKDEGINIFVDPYIRWDDCKILPKYNKSTLTSLKLNKIINNGYMNLLDEISIEKEIRDKLI